MLSYTVPVKPAIIAVTIMILAASSMLALVSPSHAAPLPMIVGERAGGSKAAGSTTGAVAQGTGSSHDDAKGRPLAEMLNTDGTLNLGTGFSGSLNMAGWKMASAPNGAPRFVPAVAGDENWDTRFHDRGTNSAVYALLVSGSTIYVGGDFTTAGGVAANRIAAWDGTTWSAL